MSNQLAIDGGAPVRPQQLVYGKPVIGEAEIDEVVATMRAGWLSTGPLVARFEREFAAYCAARQAVAVAHCTGALHLALVAAGIGSGDEVITTPFTFAATAEAILAAGATPVFVDVETERLLLNPAAVAAAITPRTRALLPVHFAGNPCAMDELLALASRHGLKVISDAAHATETRYRGRHVATLGDFACFSFYATKNLVCGEGGMLTTADAEAADRLRVMRLHGISRDAWRRSTAAGFTTAEVVMPGFKYNLTDIAAAMGIHQLARLDENLRHRTMLAERYFRALDGMPVLAVLSPTDCGTPAHHLLVIRLRLDRLRADRNRVAAAIQAEGIGVGVHFVALPRHRYFRERLGYRPEDYPVADRASDEVLSLPLTAGMNETDVDDTVAALRKVLDAYRA